MKQNPTPAPDLTTASSRASVRPDRRKFLTGLALGAGLAPLATLFRTPVSAGAAGSAQNDLCYSTAKPPLTAQDFGLLGYYDLRTFGTNTTYMRGLTHRYVNGQLRLLSLSHTGVLVEFTPAASFGQTVTASTGQWNIGQVCGDFTGIWWEEAKQRLWVTASIDYGDSGTYYPTRISTVTLGAGGAVSNVKTVSLQGINSKRVYGGVQPVPAWFQTQYGVGPYAVGFGGYTSLFQQVSWASLGPELICIPDIAGYSNGAEVPAGACRVLLDTPSGQRGVRKTIPLNYFDGGDADPNGVRRENPNSPPTIPPYVGAQWLSPNAQGLGWMVWGDSYYNTGMWIDGPNKQSFVAIASLGKGKCWYQGSTLHFDDRQFELHTWDASTLANGPQTRPTSMVELVVPRGVNPMSWDGDVPMANLSGATFDATGSRMYVVGYPLGAPSTGPSGEWDTGRLYVYSVTA
ncbi:MAG: hypothetical protein ABI634_15155 [Acidobacteriota bacterium]